MKSNKIDVFRMLVTGVHARYYRDTSPVHWIMRGIVYKIIIVWEINSLWFLWKLEKKSNLQYFNIII